MPQIGTVSRMPHDKCNGNPDPDALPTTSKARLEYVSVNYVTGLWLRCRVCTYTVVQSLSWVCTEGSVCAPHFEAQH